MESKKGILLIFIVSLIFTLSACTDANQENQNSAGGKGQDQEVIFMGIIEEIHDQTALVSVEEGEILASGNQVGNVDLSLASHITFQIGDKVRVGYDGIVRETHPLSINTTSIELIKD